MKITYGKREDDSSSAGGNEVDWQKLGWENRPEGYSEKDFEPAPSQVPGILPDQSPRQISELHDKIEVTAESTYAHKAIVAKQEAVDWILAMLGYPLVTAEVVDSQLNAALANALQTYTEYAYFPDQYVLEYLQNYVPGVGLDLSRYNVTGVKEITVGYDTIGMWGWPIMTNSRIRPFGSGTFTGSFTTFHNMVEFREMAKRVCATEPDFNFSRSTKLLTLVPEPKIPKNKKCAVPIVLTVQVEPPLWELYGDIMVRRLALAWTRIILGEIRSKYSGVTLPGGGSIDAEIGNRGREELEKLEEKLKTDRSRGQNWYFA